MTKRLVVIGILSTQLSGCFFFMFPLPNFSGPGVQAKLDKFAGEIATMPTNNAVAVAKSSDRWAWAGFRGAASPEAAKDMAIKECQRNAVKEGVSASCHVYAVNGVLER